MALHRDIYWIGRQWAVTGTGLQAVDQRLKGAFDVNVARLWEDDLRRRMHALAWLNTEDFDKALGIARARFPAPVPKTISLVESVLELIQPTSVDPPRPVALPPVEVDALPDEDTIVEIPKPDVRLLALRVEHASAKFLPQWRVKR